MHRAGLSDNGRERVVGALQAAIEHVAKKHDLSYGVGGNHIDEALHYVDKTYHSDSNRSNYLTPKERSFLEATLRSHYDTPVAANDNEPLAAPHENPDRLDEAA